MQIEQYICIRKISVFKRHLQTENIINLDGLRVIHFFLSRSKSKKMHNKMFITCKR